MTAGKNRIKNGFEEYKYFLETYLLPIIGISYDNNIERLPASGYMEQAPAGVFIRQQRDKLLFSAYNEDIFQMDWKPVVSEDILALAQNIIRSYTSVAKYKMSDNSRALNIDYATDDIREENYRLAVQKGVCDWCIGGQNEAFYRLLQILERWSVQTYEGKKVTFGFVFNPHEKSKFPVDENGTWLDFLEDDYAATLTDCIHSVIQLDKNCNFAGYLSITENDIIESFHLTPNLPYRFARVIEKYVKGTCVGIFLLNNGDIMLSKNGAIRLIKRNLKWLNLSYDMFSNMVTARVSKVRIDDSLLRQVYASTLDVSLAHTGGIIAVVDSITSLKTKNVNPILNPCDNLLDKRTLEEISDEMSSLSAYKNIKPQEKKKRMLKRKAIISLLEGKKFQDIDRKLRTELISMDGACILNQKGEVCAIGAIIQNDSGSSGGGRSAAAKKLSTYGFAVKISTDGYIELFVNYDPVYAVK